MFLAKTSQVFLFDCETVTRRSRAYSCWLTKARTRGLGRRDSGWFGADGCRIGLDRNRGVRDLRDFEGGWLGEGTVWKGEEWGEAMWRSDIEEREI